MKKNIGLCKYLDQEVTENEKCNLFRLIYYCYWREVKANSSSSMHSIALLMCVYVFARL